MQRAEILLRVVAAAGRLTVDGDDRAIDARLGDGLVAEAGDPGVEGGLEGVGLDDHQDAAEDVLAGDAVGQVEEAHEELLLGSRSWPNAGLHRLCVLSLTTSGRLSGRGRGPQ